MLARGIHRVPRCQAVHPAISFRIEKVGSRQLLQYLRIYPHEKWQGTLRQRSDEIMKLKSRLSFRSNLEVIAKSLAIAFSTCIEKTSSAVLPEAHRSFNRDGMERDASKLHASDPVPQRTAHSRPLHRRAAIDVAHYQAAPILFFLHTHRLEAAGKLPKSTWDTDCLQDGTTRKLAMSAGMQDSHTSPEELCLQRLPAGQLGGIAPPELFDIVPPDASVAYFHDPSIVSESFGRDEKALFKRSTVQIGLAHEGT